MKVSSDSGCVYSAVWFAMCTFSNLQCTIVIAHWETMGVGLPKNKHRIINLKIN